MDYVSLFTEEVALYVKNEIEWVCSAHDFFHIERVVKLATKLRAMEWMWDVLVIQISALLHESLDDKFCVWCSIPERKKQLRNILSTWWLEIWSIDRIMFIIENIGFAKSLDRDKNFPYTPEFMIVEDADRLDTIWAIAVARTFAYGGKHWRQIYDPDIQANTYLTKKDYRTWSEKSTSINHFYEKLFLLKDKIHTWSAQRIAEQRHVFMEYFLEQFHHEWNVEIEI